MKKMMRSAYLVIKILNSKGFIAIVRKAKRRLIGFIDYQNWIRKNEPRKKLLEEQFAKARNFNYRPLISLVVPVWNTPKNMLVQTISSVFQQSYDNWELCIADGNSTNKTREVLSEWMKKDDRIKVKFLEENKGIANNSNEALSIAQGEFIAFLDHDDFLAPFALFEIVKRLQIDTTADVIYSDEDKINKGGWRFEPFFKPDFSPDLLRSVNYMPHFLVVRKTIGDKIGWFREGYDGAQDYDLILRLVEKTQGIAHIQKILYHWRVWIGSTAGGTEVKPYANISGKKALQEHLDRLGLSAQVEDGYAPTVYHARYNLSSTPQVSIIILNQDHAANLRYCVDSILKKTTYPKFEILIVECGSKQQTTFNLYKRLLGQDSRVRLIEYNVNEPSNYLRVNNWAAWQANGGVLLFLNADTQVVNNDWLEQLLQFAMRLDVGAVGAKLYYSDDSIQHAGIIVGMGGDAGFGHKKFYRQESGYFGHLMVPRNISAVTDACLMIRKDIFQELGGFDENYTFKFGDVDLCLRILQEGYLNVWTPYAELYHYESKIRKHDSSDETKELLQENTNRFKERWLIALEQGDQYYSPNLALFDEYFHINSKLADI